MLNSNVFVGIKNEIEKILRRCIIFGMVRPFDLSWTWLKYYPPQTIAATTKSSISHIYIYFFLFFYIRWLHKNISSQEHQKYKNSIDRNSIDLSMEILCKWRYIRHTHADSYESYVVYFSLISPLNSTL